MQYCPQGLYVVLLANYYAVTGDLETVRKHYDFAGLVLRRALSKCHPGTHLGVQVGFFPDHPECLEHTDSDISLINNSLYYQAVCSVVELAEALGKTDDSKKYRELADSVQQDMEKILWDDETGYWVDTAEGATLRKRKYFPLYGQLHVSPYALKPHAEKQKHMAEFMKKEFVFPHGLYMYPATRPGFMADGNQLGAYYPPVDRYFWNLMNRTADTEAAKLFPQIVDYYWQRHSYPEGLTHETENDDPAIDNPGCMQAFTMKVFFCDALELNLGLQVHADGFTLNPLPSAQPFSVKNLIFRSKQMEFRKTGSKEIRLNGRAVSGKITWDMLKDSNLVEIL